MTEEGSGDQQLTLVSAAARTASRRRPAKPPVGLAAENPVAEVVIDVPLAHLDRRFEYSVPAPLGEQAVPGARVRVRFAGQDRDGFVVARKAVAEHAGRLAPLRRVVSSEPVLTERLLILCRSVADRWAGALSDVLRLAVPPRHAAAEQALDPDEALGIRPSVQPVSAEIEAAVWGRYPGGVAFLDHLRAGAAPRAAWTATPSAAQAATDWPRAIAVAVIAALSAGRAALVVVPDARDVARVDEALRELEPAAAQVVLTADLGPRARYAAWLRVLRGHASAVIGTRAAMFAPVRDLGLVVCWDDGDDLHDEPRAPYPHVREVLALRSEQEGAAALFGGFVRTAEVQRMVRSGWARPVEASQRELRRAAPRVVLPGEGNEPARDAAAATARLPSLAWRTAAQALATGPVLVQVPRGGYLPSLACQHCRSPARCAACHGPLMLASDEGTPSCRWCGRVSSDWACAECGDRRLRSQVVGAGRTAEELGRAFPGTAVLTSRAGAVIAAVPGRPALVIATPGAEPVAAGGYSAGLLLDAWALLGRADLRAGEEALRRWANAAALVRSDGTVVLVGPAGLPPVEALVRWAPTWHSERELAARQELGFPPAAVIATLTGQAEAVADLVGTLSLPARVEVLGPVPVAGAETVRVLLRAAPADREGLAHAVQAGVSVRSARKRPGAVRVQFDPRDLV